jgi:hypothetical protein
MTQQDVLPQWMVTAFVTMFAALSTQCSSPEKDPDGLCNANWRIMNVILAVIFSGILVHSMAGVCKFLIFKHDYSILIIVIWVLLLGGQYLHQHTGVSSDFDVNVRLEAIQIQIQDLCDAFHYDRAKSDYKEMRERWLVHFEKFKIRPSGEDLTTRLGINNMKFALALTR